MCGETEAGCGATFATHVGYGWWLTIANWVEVFGASARGADSLAAGDEFSDVLFIGSEGVREGFTDCVAQEWIRTC